MSQINNITDDMTENVKLTVVYDNNPLINNLETDWGFSCLIETGKTKILFDSGDNGKILLENMNKLSIDPKSIDMVFLSHFHHDHTGGLKDFLQTNSKVKVYSPQSLPQEIVNVINNSGAESISVSGSIELLPDTYSLGEIDGIIPEQSLVIRRHNEIIVITGCAHPGIINILQKAKNMFPEDTLYIALGGFHLHRLNEGEINEVIKKMFNMKVLSVAPTHCSGSTARRMFRELFDADYIDVGVGKVIDIK